MNEKQLYDISEVCNLLGTTSRTLRFYEQKGIIESTTDGFSSRRKYTDHQLNSIKNVLVLRSLNLSINDILKLQHDNADLKDVIISKRAEIIAFVEKRIREINILNDAISVIEAGESIFEVKPNEDVSIDSNIKYIIDECSDAIVFGNMDKLYEYLSSSMLKCMPPESYEKARKDTINVLGDFVSYERIEIDSKYPNRIYIYAKYQNLGLKMTFVFSNKKIDGLWLSYYNTESRWNI